MKKKIKDKEVHGLIKLSDDLIVKSQAVEIGMLKSEIDELKFKLGDALLYKAKNRKYRKLQKYIFAENRMAKNGITFNEIKELDARVSFVKLLNTLSNLKTKECDGIPKESLINVLNGFYKNNFE